MTIIGHWTNSEFKIETATFGMKEIFGEHKGEYLAPVMHELLQEYGIQDKLGWFQADNAGNNDKMLKHLDQAIRMAGGEGFDVEARRLRCLGHILNLAVKLLLFNGNVTAVNKELQEIIIEIQKDNGNVNEAKKKAWRARGVVGRLHNIIVYIRGSNQRRNSYLREIEIDMKKIPAFMLRLGNDTRWGSTYDMIKSAVKNRERLIIYINQTPELEADQLSNQDWKDLDEMLLILEPFKLVTMLGQEKGTTYGSIASTLWGFDYLLAKLEKWEKECKRSDTGFRTAVNMSWNLMKKYYGETDKCPVYIVAMILDPRFKMQYFERHWRKEWLGSAKQKMRAFYNQYLKVDENTRAINFTAARMREQVKEAAQGTVNLKPGDISDFLWGSTTGMQRDELEDYCNESVLHFSSDQERNDFDVMEYWKANIKVYPTLARIFWDICSIPSMSAEPERVFSGYMFEIVEF
jgi:hypothetical protein